VPHQDNPEALDRFAQGLIRRKVKQIVGRAGFTPQDREDLEQELQLRLWQRLPAFDPQRGHRYAFLTTVVEHVVANLLRELQAQKRDPRRIQSLHERIQTSDQGPSERATTIGQEEYDAWRGRSPRGNAELAQLAHDVAAVLAQLPAELRDLAERLQYQSLAQIARETGAPRTTLYTPLRQLRQRFEKARLQDYL
jgi:RNA polymerase sigma-70 factor (ECF subfamily)